MSLRRNCTLHYTILRPCIDYDHEVRNKRQWLPRALSHLGIANHWGHSVVWRLGSRIRIRSSIFGTVTLLMHFHRISFAMDDILKASKEHSDCCWKTVMPLELTSIRGKLHY